MTDAIKWTTRNTRQVRELLDWEDVPIPFAHFIPRRSADMTETLWLNVAFDDWGKDVTAAVYNPATKSFIPVKTGQWIIRHDDNHIEVTSERPVLSEA